MRNYHILKGLLLSHEVDLLTFGSEDDKVRLQAMLADCEEITMVHHPERTTPDRLISLLTDRRPDIAHRLISQAFDLELVRLLQSHSTDMTKPYDVVQVEGLEMAGAIPVIRKHSPSTHIVFDSHNAESELQHRSFKADLTTITRWPAATYSFIQERRLRKYEAWACNAADWVTVVSKQDQAYLMEVAPKSKMTVIPNCIDVASYAPNAGDLSTEASLVFTGKMDYRPNVDAVLWFATEVWPQIEDQLPGATWTIVGQRPHPRLDVLRSRKGITITGWVEEVLPYISAASVIIMPFRIGSGTRLKLIEAMAAGKAIVSTQVGVEGFDVQNNQQLLIADEPAAFAQAVVALLASLANRQRLGQAAIEYAQQYDWRRIVPRFDTVYRNLLA